MKFSASSESLLKQTTDLLVLPVFQEGDGAGIPQEIRDLDKTLNGVIKIHAQREEFTGKKDTSFLVQTDKNIQNILVVGLG